MRTRSLASRVRCHERGPVNRNLELPLTTVFRSVQPLILASESPRRLHLLRSLGLSFKVVPSGSEEAGDPNGVPHDLAKAHALEKAETVARQFPRSWVLSADTIVVDQHTVLGKPSGPEEAATMLQRLSGKDHQVFSGLCLLRQDPGFRRVESFRTDVRFRRLSEGEIRAYVNTGEPLDKAGAYGIQGLGAFLVESIRGSYTNVVGLPLSETLAWLCELGVVIPNESDE